MDILFLFLVDKGSSFMFGLSVCMEKVLVFDKKNHVLTFKI